MSTQNSTKTQTKTNINWNDIPAPARNSIVSKLNTQSALSLRTASKNAKERVNIKKDIPIKLVVDAIKQSNINNFKEFLKSFLSNGGDINRLYENETLLYIAIYAIEPIRYPPTYTYPTHGRSLKNAVDIFKILLANGADVNKKDLNGNTIINLDTRLIFDTEEKINIEEQTYVTKYPLLEFLLEKGLNIDNKNNKGETAFIRYCIVSGERNDWTLDEYTLEKAKILTNNGADVNLRDNNNKTGLNYISKELLTEDFNDNYSNSDKQYIKNFIYFIINEKGGRKEDIDPKVFRLIESEEYIVENSNDYNNGDYEHHRDRINYGPKKPIDYNEPVKQDGGKPKHTYKGRKYIIRTGSRGGKYILVNKTKIYV
jgi:ankyrin repeat protein